MAIVVEGTTTGGVTTGDSSTLTSWTPASNELIILLVAMRDETFSPPTASGNGITFTQIHEVRNVQSVGALTVFRGLDASPTTGSIVVSHSGNADTVSCIAIRFSGIDTSGTNGSGAIGNTNTDTGPATDDANVQISVTINSSGNFAFGSAYSRAATIDDPPAGGETTILVNQLFGTGGSQINCHSWYQTGVTGSVQLGTANNLSAVNDHVESALEIVAAGAETVIDMGSDNLDTWEDSVLIRAP